MIGVVVVVVEVVVVEVEEVVGRSCSAIVGTVVGRGAAAAQSACVRVHIFLEGGM